MVIESKLSLVDYVIVVNELVDGYFDEQGAYLPHYGMINAMRVFYNHCIKESKFDSDIPHTVASMLDIEPILEDAEFINAFNDELMSNINSLSFSCAYHNAKEIVADRLKESNSFVKLFNAAKEIIGELNAIDVNKLTDTFSELVKSNFDIDAFYKAYKESDTFNSLLESGEKDTIEDADKPTLRLVENSDAQ